MHLALGRAQSGCRSRAAIMVLIQPTALQLFTQVLTFKLHEGSQ